ncbi:MAG: serine acetyltransferase [Tannerellaceae bacterium]|jgi:serine O-acetyltransferase|nr:serine acetyltransferase [Tannerellaceae bacterium]
MDKDSLIELICRNVDRLTDFDSDNYRYIPLHQKPSPSVKAVAQIMEVLKKILFPGFFGPLDEALPASAKVYAEGYLLKVFELLLEQIDNSLCFESEYDNTREQASALAVEFINKLADIKALLSTDAQAIFEGDPAASSLSEVIFCYPGFKAILHQRVAHELYRMCVPILPRMITEMAHTETGIDIHPGAEIGKFFSIDHGTGIVIGQTTIIGDHVRLYQGVTLGAKRLYLNENGIPMNIPRHPIIKDNVTIYSNTSVLGRITIGENSVIGGNIWITNSVEPNSHIRQPKAVNE